MEIKTRKRSLKTKMILLCGIICLAILVSTNIMVNNVVDKNLRAVTKQQTLENASIITNLIDGDKHELITGESDEYYSELVTILQKCMNDGTLEYVYTVNASSSGYNFAVDADAKSPAAFGEKIESEDAMRSAFSGTVAVSEESTDKWGTYYTAYAPVINSKGDVVAVVGVDCSVDNVKDTVASVRKDFIIVSVILFIVSMVLIIIFSTKITNAVRKVYCTIYNITETDGNLVDRIYIHTGDEFELLANTINKFLDKLQGVIKETKNIGDRVVYKSLSMSTNSNNDKERIEAVSNEMQSIEETMDGVRNTISEILDHTNEILDNSKNMEQVSMEEINRIAAVNAKAYTLKAGSFRAKEEATDLLSKIKETLYERMEKMKSVEEINRLTSDIAGVAEQTKLLALNASIEAARAGESGKGFTVVASEISSLADNTDETANKITEMNQVVSDATEGMIEAVQTLLQYLENTVMDDYNKMISIGTDYDEDAGAFKGTMMKFNQMVEILNKSVEDITILVDNAADSINDSFEHINGITQATKKINDTSFATNNLISETNREIDNLKAKLSYFKTEEGLFNK